MSTSTAPAASVFELLGIKPVINARGNNTVLGGSTPSARVKRAMQDVERYYVDMQQLLERSSNCGVVVHHMDGPLSGHGSLPPPGRPQQ